MQMINRAIEDAADFTEFRRKLEQPMERPTTGNVVLLAAPPPKRPGENRQQYRARIRAKA